MSELFSEWDLKLVEFKPFTNFCTGHSQTLIGHLIKSATFENFLETDFIRLRDSDEIPIHFYIHPNSNWMVTLFHGLAGDHKSDYMQRTARIAAQLGYSVCLVDHRGTLQGKGKNKNIYHSGKYEDIEDVFDYLNHKFKNLKQIFVGFSMSGSILLNYGIHLNLAKSNAKYLIVINPPVDLKLASLTLSKGFNKIYDYRFYIKLKNLIYNMKPNFNWPFYLKIFDFDNQITAKMYGFKDALDYYEKCSTVNSLNKLKIKTFVLTSKDDPFIPFSSYKNISKFENINLKITDSGGHLGYFHKKRLGSFNHRWLDHYFYQVLSMIYNHELI